MPDGSRPDGTAEREHRSAAPPAVGPAGGPSPRPDPEGRRGALSSGRTRRERTRPAPTPGSVSRPAGAQQVRSAVASRPGARRSAVAASEHGTVVTGRPRGVATRFGPVPPASSRRAYPRGNSPDGIRVRRGAPSAASAPVGCARARCRNRVHGSALGAEPGSAPGTSSGAGGGAGGQVTAAGRPRHMGPVARRGPRTRTRTMSPWPSAAVRRPGSRTGRRRSCPPPPRSGRRASGR